MAPSHPPARSQLVYTRRAATDLRKLDPVTKKRIGRKLAEIAASGDPLRSARRLTDAKLGHYRFRIGDYRVIFDVSEERLVILRVAHRGDIYRG